MQDWSAPLSKLVVGVALGLTLVLHFPHCALSSRLRFSRNVTHRQTGSREDPHFRLVHSENKAHAYVTQLMLKTVQ